MRCHIFALALGVSGCGAVTVGTTAADRSADAALDAPTNVDAAEVASPSVVQLAVGSQSHQCALMSDGTLRCRGFNPYGQIGIGPTAEVSIDAPVTVPGLRDVEQVVVSDIGATCTRHRDGAVRCWGYNQYNTLGTGHAGDETCTPFGDPVPCRTRPALVPGLTDVVHLTNSHFSVCAVRRDGSVWCWGGPDLPYPPGTAATPAPVPGLSDVVWMRGMLIGWIVRLRDGRYQLLNRPGSTIEIPAQAEVADGMFNSHVCYRLPDATVRCVGVNANGKVGNGGSSWPGDVTEPVDPGLRGVRSIVTGAYHTCVLMEDGAVRCWGDGRAGGLGVDTTDRCVGINEPGECMTRPTLIPGIDHVDRLFLGVWGTCALRTDRSVWCWGTLGPTRSSSVPTPVTW